MVRFISPEFSLGTLASCFCSSSRLNPCQGRALGSQNQWTIRCGVLVITRSLRFCVRGLLVMLYRARRRSGTSVPK